MVVAACLFDRILDDPFGTGGLGQLAHGDHVRPGLDNLFDFQADLAQVDVEVLQDIGGDTGALLDQAQEDVLRADVLMVEALRLLVAVLRSAPRRYNTTRHPFPTTAGGAMTTAPQHTETLEERVMRLLSQWRAETAPFSSTTKITGHLAYQEIIALGQAALPLLFRDLEQTLDGHLSQALTAITGAQPVSEDERGQIRKIAETWLRWAREHGYQGGGRLKPSSPVCGPRRIEYDHAMVGP